MGKVKVTPSGSKEGGVDKEVVEEEANDHRFQQRN